MLPPSVAIYRRCCQNNFLNPRGATICQYLDRIAKRRTIRIGWIRFITSCNLKSHNIRIGNIAMRDYQSSPLWRIKRMLGEAKYCVSRLKGRSILGDIFEQALTYFTIAALAAAAAKAPCSCSKNALFCASICSIALTLCEASPVMTAESISANLLPLPNSPMPCVSPSTFPTRLVSATPDYQVNPL